MNGKGDRNRTTNFRAFREGWDKVRWRREPVYRVPSGRPGSITDMLANGELTYPIFPRGAGSVTERPYFTEADLKRYPVLRELYRMGLLRREG